MILRFHTVGLLLGASLFATPIHADTLAGALARAVSNLPEVRAARANQRASEQTIEQARGAWYPTVDLNLGRGRETSNNASTRLLGSDQTLTRREADISVSQLIYDGGATSSQVRRFQASADAATEQVAQAAENAGARAAQAYLDVIRLRELVDIAQDNENRHRETLEQISRLADVGKGKRADAQQAEARYALAQASLTQLRAQLTRADAAFLQLTGQPPGKLEKVGDFAAALPATLAAAIEQALQGQPEVRAAQNGLLAARAERESERGRYAWPQLALELGVSANHNLDGVDGAYSDRFAMLRLRYNLFRGGSDQARVRAAEARIDQALAGYGKARNDTERDMREAWDALAQDRIRLPQLQRYAAASAKVVTAYRLQFSIGQRTLLDVLNAENEYFAARSSEYAGRYAVTIDELRVLSAMGKLLEAVGVNIDAVPQTQSAKNEQSVPAVRQVIAPSTGAAPIKVEQSASAGKEKERKLDLRMAMTLNPARTER